jgi:hypothetical protein
VISEYRGGLLGVAFGKGLSDTACHAAVGLLSAAHEPLADRFRQLGAVAAPAGRLSFESFEASA